MPLSLFPGKGDESRTTLAYLPAHSSNERPVLAGRSNTQQQDDGSRVTGPVISSQTGGTLRASAFPRAGLPDPPLWPHCSSPDAARPRCACLPAACVPAAAVATRGPAASATACSLPVTVTSYGSAVATACIPLPSPLHAAPRRPCPRTSTVREVRCLSLGLSSSTTSQPVSQVHLTEPPHDRRQGCSECTQPQPGVGGSPRWRLHAPPCMWVTLMGCRV